MIEAAAKAIWEATEDGDWKNVAPLGKRFVYCEAMAALEACADHLEERYGSEHPGCLAIRRELDEFNKSKQ